MNNYREILLELDKLKGIYRRSYITVGKRTETSAEHSWHLAMALIAFERFIPDRIDINHAIRLALTHDVCEIGAGDISVYDPRREEKTQLELEYLQSLGHRFADFGQDMKKMWQEYEDKQTLESRWVHVFDRLLPFILNIATEGRNWQEQRVTKSQVYTVNSFIQDISPQIYSWMCSEIDSAVLKGWILAE